MVYGRLSIKMKDRLSIVLVRPPSPLGRFRVVNMQHPINICILGRIIESLGHRAYIYDFEIESSGVEKFASFIKKIEPDIIGFSCTTPQIRIADAISRLAKEIDPEIITIVGGAHISALPRETLIEFKNIDVGFIGEADISLRLFIESLKNNNKSFDRIPGLIYRKGNEIILNDNPERVDLSKIDYLPARHLLNLNQYERKNRFKNVAAPGVFKKHIRATQMFTSRGCIYRCIFCSNTANFGPLCNKPQIISRDVMSIKEEIEECKRLFKINHFSIQDELFPSSREFLFRFCDITRSEGVSFNCNSRVDILKEEDYKLLSESGCLQIGFGVESGSQRILNKLGKKISLDRVANAFDYAKRYKIRTVGYFLVGSHPEECEEDIDETIRFIKYIKPDLITCTIAVPFPGTTLRRMLLKKGLIFSNDWDLYAYYSDRPVWRTYYFDSDELIDNQIKILRSFYLSYDVVKRRIELANSLLEFPMLIEGGMRMMAFFRDKIKKRIIG